MKIFTRVSCSALLATVFTGVSFQQGCSTAGAAVYGGETTARAVGEESSAGHLPDHGKIGAEGTKLETKMDTSEDKTFQKVEGNKVIKEDPVRNAAYIDEGSQEVIADSAVDIAGGRPEKLNPVEEQKAQIKTLKSEIETLEGQVAKIRAQVARLHHELNQASSSKGG